MSGVECIVRCFHALQKINMPNEIIIIAANVLNSGDAGELFITLLANIVEPEPLSAFIKTPMPREMRVPARSIRPESFRRAIQDT